VLAKSYSSTKRGATHLPGGLCRVRARHAGPQGRHYHHDRGHRQRDPWLQGRLRMVPPTNTPTDKPTNTPTDSFINLTQAMLVAIALVYLLIVILFRLLLVTGRALDLSAVTRLCWAISRWSPPPSCCAISILMTAAATILAPIPLALSSSSGLIAASLATVWEGNRPTLARTAGPPCPGPAR
jgi:hypothetical protein